MRGFENTLTEGTKSQQARNFETGKQPKIAARFQSPSQSALLCLYSLCQESPHVLLLFILIEIFTIFFVKSILPVILPSG